MLALRLSCQTLVTLLLGRKSHLLPCTYMVRGRSAVMVQTWTRDNQFKQVPIGDLEGGSGQSLGFMRYNEIVRRCHPVCTGGTCFSQGL